MYFGFNVFVLSIFSQSVDSTGFIETSWWVLKDNFRFYLLFLNKWAHLRFISSFVEFRTRTS